MKFVAVFIALSGPLNAELLAHVQTTKGTVDVVLQYDKAPQAVANFITLVQGTRGHLNPLTGAIAYTPYYIGEKFFRVLNDPSFKIAQTGSGTGTNSGGPGYAFKDEFSATLTHVPYVLSMANSGPNSNGSQIFFTGNATIPSLDNVHTVFGLITEPASRAVIDAIHTAGSGGSTITGITFSRTDAAAIAFNELAQNLPTLAQPNGHLAVTLGTSAVWNFTPAISTGAIFRTFRSSTLASGSWSELHSARQHVGIGAALSFPAVLTAPLDNASASKAFYNLTVANHPGSVAPSTLANRTVLIPLVGGTYTYVFDASGVAGTTTYTPITGAPFGGPFITVNPNNGNALAPTTDAHSVGFVADTLFINPRYLWIKVGCNSATNALVTGRHSSSRYIGGSNPWAPEGTGSATISR